MELRFPSRVPGNGKPLIDLLYRARDLAVCLVLLCLLALGVSGCDAGGFEKQVTGGPRPTSPDDPRLDTVTPRSFCAGQEIVLEGINFSTVLEDNEVSFSGIPGLPTGVDFLPSNGNPADGLESRLRVLVPTGVTDGNIELRVAGVNAGVRDYTACPQIVSFGIGPTGQEPRLIHSGILGFSTNNPPTTVILFGINFDNVTQAILTDRQGLQVTIPRVRFTNRVIPNVPQNKLQTIEIDLVGSSLAVQQGAGAQRDNITISLASDVFRSNEVQVPVASFQASSPGLGAVINGILVPAGVRTGPVRIRYSMYDHPFIDQAYLMQVTWSPDGGQTNFPAIADVSDVYRPADNTSGQSDGTRNVMPGDIDFGSPAGLLFAGGALRTFTWDAQNDPNFIDLKAQGSAARNFTITFKLHPSPEMPVGAGAAVTKPGDTGHFIVSPPVAYYDLEDRGTVSSAPDREGVLSEQFETAQNADFGCTTARWGPPVNPGALRGSIPANPVPSVGLGTFNLLMERAPPQVPPITADFYVINTDDMTITHFIDDGASPTTIQVFPTIDDPNPGHNPGNSALPQFEFHVRTLLLDGVDALLEGSRPAVFRVSGANLLECSQTVQLSGNFIANGEPGTATEAGEGKAGGGDGGLGAMLTLDAAGGVVDLTEAQDGGNDGGRGGGTAAAMDPVPANPSGFKGAPGGGGGHRLAGGDGDPGIARSPNFFTVPRGGRGGPRRGSPRMVPPTGGAGGGGGGATISRTAGMPPVAVNGAGGGGGGGAVQITAHGTIVINGTADRGCNQGDPGCDPDQRFNCLADIQAANPRPINGSIQVNGGKGGDGGQNAGAGGGGSGGGILLQATGSISVNCASLLANPGLHGVTSNQNLRPGSGDGAPGWIRVEPRIGGGPYCGLLALETVLTAPLDTSQAVSKVINILDASDFPNKGVVLIDAEIIGYNDIDRNANTLKVLSRGLRGTTIANHAVTPVAARVILETPVFPPESLIRGTTTDINVTPDPILAGSGTDGVLHAFFIESTDPETGLPLVDPDTGQRVSQWTIDTDTSVVIDPTGSVILVASQARTNPGLFSFSRLRIDANVVLRAVGSRPLRIFVSEVAEIAGVLDASGFDGGPLRFDVNSRNSPDPGLGGRPGPGGGEGGQGGTITFLDKDVTNKAPSNVLPVAARPGGMPSLFPPEFDRTGDTSATVPPPSDLAELEATHATPGEPLRDPAGCGPNCTSGGGAGGGSLLAGADGQSCPPNSVFGPPCAPRIATFGRAGSRVGLDNFRYGGRYLLTGGSGGSGGGASADVSDEYRNGQAGNAIFRAAARYAPGTGGGGGGGIVHLVVQGSLMLRSSGGILVRGGNASQSIDLGGNGGAGAGGSVLIQLANSMTIEPGARIDASGGVSNRPPPTPAEQTLPLYEGNLRQVGNDLRSFGGMGGKGAVGRVRLEAPANSNLLKTSLNDNLSSSVMLLDASLSTGCSVTLPLGVGPGGRALSHLLEPDSAGLRFAEGGLPDGTDAFVLWQGGGPSFDVHGEPGPVRGGVEDLRDLQDMEYVQFTVYIISNTTSRETPTIREVNVPFRLGNPK